MTSDGFRRLKSEAGLILDLLDIVAAAVSPGSSGARTAKQAVLLIRAVLAAAERGGEVYAETVERLNTVATELRRMRDAATPPTALDWERMRQSIEGARSRIASAGEGGGS